MHTGTYTHINSGSHQFIYPFLFAGVANTGGGGGGNHAGSLGKGKGISVQSAFTCFLSFSCNVCSSGGNGGSGFVLFKYVA